MCFIIVINTKDLLVLRIGCWVTADWPYNVIENMDDKCESINIQCRFQHFSSRCYMDKLQCNTHDCKPALICRACVDDEMNITDFSLSLRVWYWCFTYSALSWRVINYCRLNVHVWTLENARFLVAWWKCKVLVLLEWMCCK